MKVRIFLRRTDGYVARQGESLIATRYIDSAQERFSCVAQAVQFLRGEVQPS